MFGSATGGRLHSSTVTLNAVAADRRGKRAKANPVKSLFPGAKSLQGRYPYLSRRPYLLPVAWVSRIWGYARETAAGEGSSSTAESLKIADQRIDLFRKYRIIN